MSANVRGPGPKNGTEANVLITDSSCSSTGTSCTSSIDGCAVKDDLCTTSDPSVTVKGHGSDCAVCASDSRGTKNHTAETGGEAAAKGYNCYGNLRGTGTNKFTDDLSLIN